MSFGWLIGLLVGWLVTQTFEMHKMADSDVFLHSYHLSFLIHIHFHSVIHSFIHSSIHSKTSNSVSSSLACKCRLLSNLKVIVKNAMALATFVYFPEASEIGSSYHMIISDSITYNCFVFLFLQS